MTASLVTVITSDHNSVISEFIISELWSLIIDWLSSATTF